MEDWENTDTEYLLETVLKLKNLSEAKKFFRDLLTEHELIEFGTRWKLARLLHQGIPYSQIEEETGISSATIARISHWLKHGEGGYELMLKRLDRE